MASAKSPPVKEPLAPTYSPPKTGIVLYFPPAWVPYGELMRLDKPAGIYLFYLPHLVGTLYAACIINPKPPLPSLVKTNLIFFVGTVFMRGSACSWNDNLDQDYDRQVFRCKTRPIARGAITTARGHAFTAFLTAIASTFLVLLPSRCMYYAVPSIFLLWLYPFGKRFTDYPQIILGLQMSIGIFMGMVAMGVDPTVESEKIQGSICALYTSFVAWTVVYDTVYARQDIKDDAKAGVKSMSVKFQHWTKALLWVCATTQAGLLVLAGVLADMGAIYFTVACGGTALSLVVMIQKVKLEEPANCMWWFKNAFWHVGIPVCSGLVGEYYT
ncbi:MAG: Para-hydroxybenzoate--polyprenyltransferase, mitochondrial precursor (PHB:polyprenyltransferase) [Alectoria fallacina]|uniref:4-hydroxybenzoate polyprenyltransferase, mitochondrial n=1 Tax=Alectoria fallacina TaxID=1903189 RepID=A0A8H3IC32_9LECA|nr:MAG: Para-hydroxybenzoate--polyprenyltransferase, mitochondrial precursor (PHB:polyprenyltransferase) [Alectoria fallacina]